MEINIERHKKEALYLAAVSELNRKNALLASLRNKLANLKPETKTRSRYYHDVAGNNFDAWVKSIGSFTLEYDEDDGIMIVWSSLETGREIEESKAELINRIDKLNKHYIPQQEAIVASLGQDLC